ncbi:hypothetical protein BC936DRAFT_144092 [Jimgerdemannia flammicorona]|uniref:Uncharacterized protein n=1 Tax=Jimgerdemannia flammicorona TaxID=994334 RepID=A0A433DD39_9FUNG|nr:hypothetical protein BC936DRAFT_144092 [Jimgerdemannia flammicorona]
MERSNLQRHVFESIGNRQPIDIHPTRKKSQKKKENKNMGAAKSSSHSPATITAYIPASSAKSELVLDLDFNIRRRPTDLAVASNRWKRQQYVEIEEETEMIVRDRRLRGVSGGLPECPRSKEWDDTLKLTLELQDLWAFAEDQLAGVDTTDLVWWGLMVVGRKLRVYALAAAGGLFHLVLTHETLLPSCREDLGSVELAYLVLKQKLDATKELGVV